MRWYSKVLGLNELRVEAWGESTVFMVSGETSVAIFPIEPKGSTSTRTDNMVHIDLMHLESQIKNFSYQGSFEKNKYPDLL